MKRFKSNKAASNTIEFLILLVVVFLIFSILIDYNSWSINRNAIQAAAQNGARLVSVYGGDGGTKIEEMYGDRSYSNCYPGLSSAECFVLQEIQATPLVGSVRIKNIECRPDVVKKVGTRTECLVEYTWGGLIGSPLMRMEAFREVSVLGSSASEVQFNENRNSTSNLH